MGKIQYYIFGALFYFLVIWKRRQPKIFHLSDLLKLQPKNMLKPTDRIGCNDSPFSLVNQQMESMTEKFFKESFSPLLWLWTKVTIRNAARRHGPPEAKIHNFYIEMDSENYIMRLWVFDSMFLLLNLNYGRRTKRRSENSFE